MGRGIYETLDPEDIRADPAGRAVQPVCSTNAQAVTKLPSIVMQDCSSSGKSLDQLEQFRIASYIEQIFGGYSL